MSYKDLEKRKEYNKQYHLKNKEKIAERKRIYQLETKEKIAEYRREYRLKNKEKIADRDKQYRLKNKEKLAEKRRIHRLKNREKIAERRRERYANDPIFRISVILRSRIGEVLRGKSKSASTLVLLGCDIETFKKHIEAQWTEGMDWSNHSLTGWHVDHIVPCATFDFTDPEQQRKCFNYTNLQPLWALDNLRKGDKIDT